MDYIKTYLIAGLGQLAQEVGTFEELSEHLRELATEEDIAAGAVSVLLHAEIRPDDNPLLDALEWVVNNEQYVSKAKESQEDALLSGVQALQDVCFGNSTKAGWWHDIDTGEPLINRPHIVGEKMMLMVSEVAEAMEGHRKNLMDDKLPHRPMVEVELADAMIRIADTAGALGLDLAGAIVEKLEYNRSREDHKIENRKKADGKKY